MAINKNHEFEELNGIKCAIVEKGAPQPRVDFLKTLLEYNGYTVLVTAAAPPKAASLPATAEVAAEAPPSEPDLFTVGVTDVMFNPTNAVYGRLLKTPDGRIVTPAFWQQKEAVAQDEVPYFEKR